MRIQKTKSPSPGERVATLLRIWRSAIVSGDTPLRIAAETELTEYGVTASDLRLPSREMQSRQAVTQ